MRPGTRLIALAALSAAPLLGCSSDPAAPPGTANVTVQFVGPDGKPITTQQVRPCAELFAEGVTIPDTKFLDTMCADADGDKRIYGAGKTECTDGRRLMWNDVGWGYVNGPLHRHAAGGEKVAPKAERLACDPSGY